MTVCPHQAPLPSIPPQCCFILYQCSMLLPTSCATGGSSRVLWWLYGANHNPELLRSHCIPGHPEETHSISEKHKQAGIDGFLVDKAFTVVLQLACNKCPVSVNELPYRMRCCLELSSCIQQLHASVSITTCVCTVVLYYVSLIYRVAKENRLLAGLWYGNAKPDMTAFLRPTAETLSRLHSKGMGVHTILFICFVIYPVLIGMCRFPSLPTKRKTIYMLYSGCCSYM